jgi:hypothetical protein
MSKAIFYHVGTGKTGTTYLQYRVFPKLEGIQYIQRTKFKRYPELIAKSNSERILLSREFDQQLEREIKAFTRHYPDTTPIIVFRRHDGYIASQYRRFVKNGFGGSFTDFFDLDRDQGYFKQIDLNYRHQIDLLKQYFTKEPIVLIYEDMRADPEAFLRQFADLVGAGLDLKDVNLDPKHTSYSPQQLKYMQQVGKRINMRKRRVYQNAVLHFFWKLYMGAIRYTVLFIGKHLPASRFDNEPLIPPEELERVKETYAEDWEVILNRKSEIGDRK